MTPSPRALSRAAFFTLLLTACLFGANHVAARLAFNHGLDVATAVLVRSFVTAAVVGGIVWLQGVPLRITPRQRGFLLLISALVAVQSLCLYAAVVRLPVALALLTFNTYPLWTALFAWLLYRHRPERAVLLAMPVLLFGLGGELVEVFKDRSLGLPPLTATLARRMMERTKVYTALKGVRGRRSIDMAALEQLMVRFSELVVEQPAIAELDINPLLASPDRLLALDARVILHPGDVAAADLPRPAIRPYPRKYSKPWKAPNGLDFVIRPIRPEDEALVVDFHGRLSDETVYQRFFSKLGYEQRVAHERLVRVCFTDYDREIALVAEQLDQDTSKSRIAGVARMVRRHNTADAEVSLVVCDECQGQGLGTELVRRLVEVGREEGIERLVADVLSTNGGMIRICQELGFSITAEDDGKTVQAELRLQG